MSLPKLALIAATLASGADYVQGFRGLSTIRLTSVGTAKLPFLLETIKSTSYHRRRISKTYLSDQQSFESTVTATTTRHDPDVPTVQDLVKFGLPTLGIWLLQPILSLIDTSVVGMSSQAVSTVVELAALGPGIAWIDSSAYMCQFIGMATTNLYANAISEGDENKQRKVLSHALVIASGFGFLLFLIQSVFSKTIITLLAGSAVESIPFALQYSRIRAIGALVSVPTIVGQAAFLARKDSVTPLRAVLVGAMINILGDILLVSYFKKGIAGAAVATMLSQLGSALYLVYASLRPSVSPAAGALVSVDTGTPAAAVLVPVVPLAVEAPGCHQGSELVPDTPRPLSSTSTSTSSFSFSSSAAKTTSIMKNVQIPSKTDLLQFLSFCGPLFFVLLTKSFLWSYTTYACSTAGAVSLAAHQIIINIFCFFAIFGDAVSQTSQTFLPAYLGGPSSSKLSHKQFDAGSKVISNVMKISLGVGLFNSAFSLVAVQRYGHRLFTKSKEINVAMASVATLLSLCVFPNTLMAGLEGVLIATRDVKFHWLSYLFIGSAFLVYQTFVRTRGLGLPAVWLGLTAFQAIRATVFGLRVHHILSKKKASLSSDVSPESS